MRYHCPWAECYICGEEWPQSKMVRHIRSGRLVDPGCDDELGYSDIRALSELPFEERNASENPIKDQGGIGYDDEGGAGGGGAGGGGAGQ